MYNEKNVKAIIAMIKNGASFAELAEVFGFKKIGSVKDLLNKHYTVKKAIANGIYAQLKKNNRNSRVVQSAVAKEETESVPAEEIISKEKITVIGCSEERRPEVEYLIDCNLGKSTVSSITGYLRMLNISNKVSESSDLITEAMILGGPAVVTDNANAVKCWEKAKQLKFVPAKAFQGFVCEESDIEWALEKTLPGYSNRKSGGIACDYNAAINEFAKNHSLTSVEMYVDGKLINHNFCTKTGTTVKYIGKDCKDTTYTWEYQVQDSGKFKEVRYTSQTAECKVNKLIKTA